MCDLANGEPDWGLEGWMFTLSQMPRLVGPSDDSREDGLLSDLYPRSAGA